MGVPGLETFLQKEVPNGVFRINVLDEINRRKSEHPDQPIVLVFQMVDLVYNIFRNLSTAEVLCGPAFRKIKLIFEDNFRLLATSAAELHFFVNEPAYHKDLKVWSIKESHQYSTRIALIDKMDSNVRIDKKIPNEAGASAALPNLLEICKMYGTVHLSVDPHYIANVAQFSNERKAMAILGNNSNFLIFNGAWRYWSCKDIDLMGKNWNTLEFSRDALLGHIGLSRPQMPMFATIAGNDYVSYDKVFSFHKSIDGNKFLKLAEYVQHIPNVLTDSERKKLILDLFGSSAPVYFEIIRKSLLFYAMKKGKTNEVVDPLLDLGASISAVYYNSLKELPIRVKPPTFYDLRRTDFSTYSDVVLPILKRQVGFVRKHMNDTNYQQVLELRLTHTGRIRSVRVTPDYPLVEIPELMELSINKNSDYYNGVRFKLLKWMIFGDEIDSNFLIQRIPKGFMVAVVTVMYLCKLKQLRSSEAYAILFTIHSISVNEEYAKDFDVPVKISSRDVLASHLYIFVHNTIVKCFQFLGLNDFVDYLSIDGVYFVHWVNKIKTEGGNEETLSEIEYLKQFLRFI